MENNNNKNSNHMLSFPEKTDSNEFEFGCITPTSPSSLKTVSPADQFFLNGRLLPHSFPVQARRSTSECTSRATTSRTSSIGSSLLSSRSNSTNSSMSGTTCNSSARSSASDVSERKAFQKKLVYNRTYSQGSGSYGSSQRWQFISPAPVLDPSLSRRRRCSGELKMSPMMNKNNNKSKNKKMSDVGDERLGFCQKILRSFVRNCRACHAMEGAAVGDDDNDDFGSHLEIK